MVLYCSNSLSYLLSNNTKKKRDRVRKFMSKTTITKFKALIVEEKCHFYLSFHCTSNII